MGASAFGDGPGATGPPKLTPDDRKSMIAGAILDLQGPMGYGLVPMEAILAESELESAHWTSDLIANANNAFGMTMPTKRETTANFYVIGEGGAHMAGYASLYDCVKDYFLRQQYDHIPNTASVKDYITATVGSGYATDPAYAAKWAQLVIDGVDVGEGIAQDDGSPGGGSFFKWLAIIGLGWAITK